MYVLVFILGIFCGMFTVGIVMASSRQEEIQEAYEKGREDERGRILEAVETKFGGNNDAKI